MVNATTERVPHDPQTTQRVEENFVLMEQVFYEAIKRGQQTGEIDPTRDAHALARFLIMAMQGLRVIGKAKPDQTTLEDAVNVTLAAIS
jgi:TetR/AcrR family transcriptional repressor of nem operon